MITLREEEDNLRAARRSKSYRWLFSLILGVALFIGLFLGLHRWGVGKTFEEVVVCQEGLTESVSKESPRDTDLRIFLDGAGRVVSYMFRRDGKQYIRMQKCPP